MKTKSSLSNGQLSSATVTPWTKQAERQAVAKQRILSSGQPVQQTGRITSSNAQKKRLDGVKVEQLTKLEQRTERKGDEPEPAPTNDAQRCRLAIREAARTLRAIDDGNSQFAVGKVTEAVGKLQGSLSGSAKDLDNLLEAVSILLKATVNTLSRLLKPTGAAPLACAPDLDNACASFVYATVRFMIRYLGTPPSDGVCEKAVTRFQQRKEAAKYAIKNSIDSVLWLAKSKVAAAGLPWETLDSALQDCSLLAERFDSTSDPESVETAESHSQLDLPFLKISNMYWTYYLKLKQESGMSPAPGLLKSIRRSVDALLGRPLKERQAGFMAVKLERLASNYSAIGQLEEARYFLIKSVEAHIEGGVLHTASVLANTKSPLAIWETEGEVGILGRVLCSLCKTTFKCNGTPSSLEIPYDDSTLEVEERAVLLEWQLLTICSIYSTSTSPGKYVQCTQSLVSTLLKLYGEDTHPVRRLRVLLCWCTVTDIQACATLSGEPAFMSEQLLESASNQSSLGHDKGLARYREGLQATFDICRAMSQSPPPLEKLKAALMSLDGLVRSCNSWAALVDRIEDQRILLEQLHSVADFFDMQGLFELRTATLALIVSVYELQERPDYAALVADISKLGLQYLRLGYSGKAGLWLAKAQGLIEHHQPKTEAKLQWHLAYAEYLVGIGSITKGSEFLASTESLAENHCTLEKDAGGSATMKGRLTLTRMLAEACYVHSLLQFEEGSLPSALSVAKRCVRLNYRAWATLDSMVSKTMKSSNEKSGEKELDGLSEGIANLSVSAMAVHPVISGNHHSLNGPPFWPLVASLYRSLYHLSRLYSHQGMFQEAVYYAEQAQKIAEAVKATCLISHSLITVGECWIRGGKSDKGHELIQRALHLRGDAIHNKDMVSLHCTLGRLHQSRGEVAEEMAAYDKAEKITSSLCVENFISSLHDFNPSLGRLERDMDNLHLGKKPGSRRIPLKPAQNPPASRKKQPCLSKTPKAPMATATSAAVECQPLLRLKADIFRHRSLALLLQQKCEQAAALLADAEGLPNSRHGIVQQQLASAKQLLSQGLEQMSSDPVFCVLHESTISFPALAPKVEDKKALEKQAVKRVSSRDSRRPTTRTSPPKKARARSKTPLGRNFVETLLHACERLSEVRSIAVRSSSTAVVYILSSVLTSVSMLLSATQGQIKSFSHPNIAMCWAELSRMLPFAREKALIRAEALSTNRDDLLKWPKLDSIKDDESIHSSTALDYPTLQKDYINIMPPDWTVISMSVTEDREDLYISKFQPGHSPFILRLPLGRHSSRDADEEVFNFQQGQAELREIIELSNFSTHGAKDMTKAGAKSEWWAEREALDARLKDLLVNIENIWLGGFKGILSQRPRVPELLSRFQNSFQVILDKHLPSRQKSPGRSKASRITLDVRILELFVNLGDPNATDIDLDEPLTDLLYFVVDILQFHGERNAYDEVDFDSIVVETQDALRCYHDALRSTEQKHKKNHTILILDKALHAFPWESLPCMEDESVSRLPSIACLRQLLLAQTDCCSSKPAGHYIDRKKGAYVLNPAGDLKNTQASFEGPLQSLSSWGAIVQREPTEEEMKQALSKDLFLYFGHGSGAQFIRGRTIKKLESAAVTLLMGCSSGALTEAGEYEPYGTPMNYMHGGSAALVATLWDVTDKDIDRFTHDVFGRWGLFPEGVSATVPKGKRRKDGNRSKQKNIEPRPSDGGSVSLVEAVAKSRDSCILRYLNGAAPVVYGIPVYFLD